MPLSVLGMTFVLVIIIDAAFTVRVAYVTRHDDLRKRILARHKKRGKAAFEAYSQLYTGKAVRALELIILALVTHLASEIVEQVQGRVSILSLIIGGVGFVVLLIGLYLLPSFKKRD